VHAADIARMLGVKGVVVPYFPGGFSAVGMVVAPLRSEHAISEVGVIDSIGPARLQEVFDELDAKIIEDLIKQGVPRGEVVLDRSLHGHYVGQGFANRIPFHGSPVTDDAIEEWKQSFHGFYDRTYGYSAPESPIEVTTMTVSGSGRPGTMPVTRVDSGAAEPPTGALVTTGDVCLDGQTWQQVPFYHRAALLAGNTIQGPAVIDDGLSTILVIADSTATVDEHGNILIEV
jgi:N-methylhydantoinase A